MSACYDHSHEPTPVNPDRLTGPEVGELVRYQYKDEPAILARVAERSYIWSPEVHHPSGYHGFRRYDWTVIQTRESGMHARLVVDDTDLRTIKLGDVIS